MKLKLDFSGIFLLAGFITTVLFVGDAVMLEVFNFNIGFGQSFNSFFQAIGFYFICVVLVLFTLTFGRQNKKWH